MTERLERAYFDLGRLAWRDAIDEPGGIEFNLPISSWIRLFHDMGFDVIDYIEVGARRVRDRHSRHGSRRMGQTLGIRASLAGPKTAGVADRAALSQHAAVRFPLNPYGPVARAGHVASSLRGARPPAGAESATAVGRTWSMTGRRGPGAGFRNRLANPAPGVTSNTTRNDARGRRLMRTMIIHTVRLSQVGALIATDPAFLIADP